MALRGHQKRPWFEIQRTELEQQYMRHQIRTLQSLAPDKPDVVWDEVMDDKFYSDFRSRLQSDALWPAYEMMYPRDEKVITSEILHTCGFIGLACVFLDYGAVRGRKIVLPCRNADPKDFLDLTGSLGYKFKKYRNATGRACIYTEGEWGLFFAKDLHKVLHRTMKNKIKPFIECFEPEGIPRRPR